MHVKLTHHTHTHTCKYILFFESFFKYNHAHQQMQTLHVALASVYGVYGHLKLFEHDYLKCGFLFTIQNMHILIQEVYYVSTWFSVIHHSVLDCMHNKVME